MAQEPQRLSILDARLAEIDRRLGTIQTGLAVDAPEPSAMPVPRAAPVASAKPVPSADLPRRLRRHDAPQVSDPPRNDAPELLAQLRELAGAHARLLDSMQELIAAYELAIGAALPAVRELSVSAGPLKSTEALRGFERTLSRIPEVRGVEVRGYEGGDRAIVDVQLFDASS